MPAVCQLTYKTFILGTEKNVGKNGTESVGHPGVGPGDSPHPIGRTEE